MMSGFGWDMGVGGWLWMGAGLVLAVVLVALLVVVATGRDRRPADDAAQILRSRFARGEITEAEYEQARRLLGL